MLAASLSLRMNIWMERWGVFLQQYSPSARPAAESISRFIADSFPSTVDTVSSSAYHIFPFSVVLSVCVSESHANARALSEKRLCAFPAASELRRWLSATPSSLSPSLSAPYKVLILPGLSAPRSPSLLIKHTAHANKLSFRFCYFSPSREVYEREEVELRELLQNPPTWISPNGGRDDAAQRRWTTLPVEGQALRELRLGTFTSLFLFADEGAGVSRLHREVPGVRSKSFDAAAAVGLTIENFREVRRMQNCSCFFNFFLPRQSAPRPRLSRDFPSLSAPFALFSQATAPLLFKQNAASLCRSSPRRRVFCLVVVDKEVPEDAKGEESRVIDLSKIKKMLGTSKNRYLRGPSSGLL